MNRKITPEQVARIRHLRHTQHLKLRELSALFGVTSTQGARIANGENWKSVTRPTPPPSTKSLRNAESKR